MSTPETEPIPPSSGNGEAATLPPTPPGDPECTAEATGQSPVDPELVSHPRYEIAELLGSGGMGAVYRATHRLMKRTVALKVLREELVANPRHVERFHREVEAAARLHHPHIVTAYDADQAGHLHLLVMEHVEGKDLHKVIAERGPLPVADACAYVRQAALGLQHAMDNGMVHRDIKPQNLILTPAGEVKILDFGLASFVREQAPADPADTTPGGTGDDADTRLTLAGTIMGTPDYLAPEQAGDARSADIRADIYSLGCTLYYLITGEVVFPGGTALDKIVAHAQQSPRSVRQLRSNVPMQLSRLVTQMLSKDPASRPQSPAEVARRLQAIERRLAPCPRGIQVASWLWIAMGVLTISAAVGGVGYYGASFAIAIVPSMFGLIFLYKGVVTLLGKNVTLIRDGIASINMGGAGFIGGVVLLVPLRLYLLAPVFLVCGLMLLAAGLLLLFNRRAYLSWVHGDTAQRG